MKVIEHGSHGTAKSWAEAIVKQQGFNLTSPGRRGRGAYLWRKSSFYLDLGKAWASQRVTEDAYSAAKDQTPSVVIVDLECDQEAFLDLLDPDVADKVHELVRRFAKPKLSHKEIMRAYDFALTQIERTRTSKLHLIRATVNAPNPAFTQDFYDALAYGWPVCLIVRNNDIIKDIRVAA